MLKPYYSEAGITIYCGDNQEILPQIEAVDCVITDPPYSAHTHAKQWISKALSASGDKRAATAFSELGFDPLTDDVRNALCEWTTKNCRRWFLAFTDIESIADWKDAIVQAGFDYVRACIWDKVDSAPQFTGDRPAASAEGIVCAHSSGKKHWNGGGRRNVFRHAVNREHGAKPHPSTKPLPLMSELVILFSDVGETIIDPFAGSCATGLAAKNLGRNAILIEREEKYCEAGAKRLSQGVLGL